MKEKGIDSSMNYSDLSLGEDDDPLPRKFRFPDMKKFTGIEDPHLHLKQYATHMRTTSLNRSQIIKQFSLSLEGALIIWYYSLEPHVQADWEELCAAFVKQYNLNIQMEASLRDLQNIRQKFNEPFADFLIRWRAKLALMKHRPSESDQLVIAIEGCVLPLSKKLKDLGIRNFEELYQFGVQKESDLA